MEVTVGSTSSPAFQPCVAAYILVSAVREVPFSAPWAVKTSSESGLVMVPSVANTHFVALELALSQSYLMTYFPGLSLEMVMHLPFARIVPSVWNVHCLLSSSPHDHSWMTLPSKSSFSSTHNPDGPLMGVMLFSTMHIWFSYSAPAPLLLVGVLQVLHW